MKKLIFVSSPLRGDIKGNLEKAKKYAKLVSFEGIPIVPHLYFTTFLDDSNKADRWTGRRRGLQLLEQCQEMWVFADEVTEGMIEEIKTATELKIPIKFYNADREEINYDALIINRRIGPGYRKIIADAHGDCSCAWACAYAGECGAEYAAEHESVDNGNKTAAAITGRSESASENCAPSGVSAYPGSIRRPLWRRVLHLK